jgi:hypothetical protein
MSRAHDGIHGPVMEKDAIVARSKGDALESEGNGIPYC